MSVTREEMLATAERITGDAALRLLLAAIAELRGAMVMPAPIVTMAPPDLSAVVTAVNGLKPGVDAEEIATAIARVIQPPQDDAVGSTLGEVVKVLEKLEFRMRAGAMPAFGASGPSNISDNASRELGLVTIKNPNGPTPNQLQLFDYAGRADTNPVYMGTAPQGSATADGAWLVQKLEYDGAARLTRMQSLVAQVWDNRASLAWS